MQSHILKGVTNPFIQQKFNKTQDNKFSPNTHWKFNIVPKNRPLEKEIPIGNHHL